MFNSQTKQPPHGGCFFFDTQNVESGRRKRSDRRVDWKLQNTINKPPRYELAIQQSNRDGTPTDLQNPKTKKKIVIEVTIHGDKKSFSSGLSIAELLSELKLNSRAIAVEINQQIKPRDTHETTRIQDGDMLEIVTLVGGG